MSKEHYYEKLRQAVLNYDAEGAKKTAEEALKAGVDPVQAIEKGLTVGIREVGEKFHRLEIFLPHLIMAADAMMAAVKVLEAAFPKDRVATKAKFVIGCAKGEEHDIGKNIVAAMLKAAGFDVYDIGRNVDVSVFINKAKEVNADIIGMSALMTSTMPEQADLVKELKHMGLKDKFKVMIGGGQVTPEWVKETGADGYGKDASEAVEVAKKLIGK
jgi:corrinoid protein of di/trimethylamine methyltransferase